MFSRSLSVARLALTLVAAGASRLLYRTSGRPFLVGGLLCAALLPGVARAQWITESYTAKAGWTSIWVNLDLSHTTIDLALAGKTDIEEVWRWNPPSGAQFTASPTTPVQQNASWNVWKRGLPLQSTLFAFTGNAAYLVKVRDGAPDVSFTLKGRPARPDYPWSTSGVNFVGFAAGATSSTLSNFLTYNSAFATDPTILSYVGGALSSTTPKNPVAVINTSEILVRNKAYWIQATQFTDYYGPIALQIAERSGINFGKDRVAVSMKLKNVTSGTRAQSVTVTLSPVASEAPPAILAGTAAMGTGATAGKVTSIFPDINNNLTYATTPIVTLSPPTAGTTATATAVLNTSGKIVSFTVTNGGAGYGATTPTVSVTPVITNQVPLKIRGAFNPTTSTYAYTSLATPQTITLTNGQETEVVLVADRTSMGTTPGALFASLLRVTDSIGLTRIDLPVTAVTGDFSGLWTGVATINLVDQIIGDAAVTQLVVSSTATVASGAVTAVAVNSTAAYFTSQPAVVFTGGGGTGAAGTAVLTKGLLTGVTLTAGGTGYTTAPTVTFAGGQIDQRATASGMSLRLLVHRSANGDTRLIQQAYLGSDGVSTTIATAENLFPSTLKPASRLSSAHFPTDFIKLGTGSLSSAGTVTFEVLLDYDADSNPFVHRYHPDHDNLDARFATKLPNGRESFTIRRVVTLEFKATLPGVNDPAWGVTMIGGNYSETITGLRAIPITCGGTFILYRVADGSTLLTP